MNKTELQAIRRHLFFSVTESSCMISHTSERAWRNWENGIAPVPADVADKLKGLCDWRENMLLNMERIIVDMQQREPFIDVKILWYASAEDWASLPDRDPIEWRPHCSILADLMARLSIHLVVFDATRYDAWCTEHGYKDSEQMRGQWAARNA